MDTFDRYKVESLNTQAVAMVRIGNVNHARQLWSQALELDPDALPIRTNLARLLFQNDCFEEVVSLGTQLVPEQTQSAALAALIGQSALRVRAPAQALCWLSVADRLRPNEASLQFQLSEALIACGHVRQAVDVLEALVQSHPAALEPQLNLAVALTESGSVQAAFSCFEKLLSCWPQDSAVLMNAVRFHLDHGDLQLAHKFVVKLLALEPQSRAARALFAEVCRNLGNIEQARNYWQQLLDQQPSDLHAHLPLIFSAMDRGEWCEASERLQAAFASCHGHVPSQLLSALADLPASIRADKFPEWPLKTSCLVQQVQLLQPDDPILSNWITCVKTDPNLIDDRPGKPTIGGLQSHELLNRLNDPFCQSVLSRLTPAVDAYINEYLDQFPYNHYSKRTSASRFSGWAVVLRPRGRQLRHTHPEAQISGVLYLRIPPQLAMETNNEGCLWFSPNPVCIESESGLTVRPRPGLLVIFPSFLPHETIPYMPEGERICIAFNVS